MYRITGLLLLAATLTLSLPASRAHACKWDRETNSREVEFRRQYNSQPVESPGMLPSEPDYFAWTMLGVGGVLLVGSVRVGVGVSVAMTRKSV